MKQFFFVFLLRLCALVLYNTCFAYQRHIYISFSRHLDLFIIVGSNRYFSHVDAGRIEHIILFFETSFGNRIVILAAGQCRRGWGGAGEYVTLRARWIIGLFSFFFNDFPGPGTPQREEMVLLFFRFVGFVLFFFACLWCGRRGGCLPLCCVRTGL